MRENPFLCRVYICKSAKLLRIEVEKVLHLFFLYAIFTVKECKDT